MKKNLLILLISVAGLFSVKAQTLQDGLNALDFERYEYAREVFKKLIIAEPNNGNNYYYLGQAYVYLLQNDSVFMSYQNGIKNDPNNAVNYVGLGEFYLNENKIADAKVQFDKSLSFSKAKDGTIKDARILAMVAQAMVNGENKLTDDALIYINQALQIDKKNYDILIMAGDVMLERNEGGPAATFYEKAIDIEKKNPKAYTRVAGIWLRVKNAEATITELTRALSIDSNYAPALKSLAEYYYQTRQFEKAKETYKRYLQNSEESNANKIRFAQILFKTKEYEESLTKILEIQKTDVNNIFLFRLAGYSYYEVGESKKDTTKYRPGAQSMETFLAKVDPRKIISSDYEYYGKLLSKIQGRENDAIENLNKCISLDSSKIEIYSELGKKYNTMKRYQEASTSFETYINKKKNPNAGDYYLLGRILYNSKQYGKADTAFMKVNEMKPDYTEAYLYRGYSNSGLDPDMKTGQAKPFFEKYILLMESTPDKNKSGLINAYNFMAKFYIIQEDNTTAKGYFNKILSIDPENKDAKEYLKQLSQQKGGGKN